MKKIIIGMMMVSSLSLMASENVKIDKQVTGVNKETIEVREIEQSNIKLKKENIEGSKLKVSDENIKNSKETVILRQDNSLDKELSGEVEKESSFLKVLLGILGVAAIAVAL